MAKLDLDVAAVRDALGVVDRLRRVGEEHRHLFLALDVELAARVAHAVFVAELFAGLDAEQDVVRLAVRRLRVVHVVCRDERDPEAPRHADERLVDALLVVVAVVLQFQEEIAFSEAFLIAECRFFGLLKLSAHDIARQLAREAGGRRDEPLVILPQQVHVHARLVVVALREGAAHDL